MLPTHCAALQCSYAPLLTHCTMAMHAHVCVLISIYTDLCINVHYICSILLIMNIPQILVTFWTITQRMP